jgi:hypothetical protein
MAMLAARSKSHEVKGFRNANEAQSLLCWMRVLRGAGVSPAVLFTSHK